MARLIFLNGAPGSGKTSLARRYLADHPLTLLVDIDALRAQLGQWERRDESRTMARELALVLAEAQLRSGHDVIVPQYVGRIEFIERLEALARRCGAEWLEVVLVTEPAVAVERFRRRRVELRSSRGLHPESDVGEAEIEQVVGESLDRIAGVLARRPAARTLPADADLGTTYRDLAATLGGTAS